MTLDLSRESFWDIRRRSHGNFFSKSGNAFHCAKILSQHKGDNSHIVLYEGFLRESSLAIELMIKAVITLQINAAPANSHDVYELWHKAKLPELSNDDWMRLIYITEILYWSGRYAAPTSDKNLKLRDSRNVKHQRMRLLGKSMVIEETPYDWEDFERLWRIIVKCYWDLHDEGKTQLK